MLLVVLYHSCIFWNGEWFTAVKIEQPSKIIQIIPIWLNSFHIYGFTLVSGFIFAYLQSQKHYPSIVVLLRKKSRRLLIPYAFICLSWVIPISQYFFNYSLYDLIKKYLLGIAPSQLWFLLMLFDVFVLAFLLEPLFRSNIYATFVIGIVTYGCGLVGARIAPNILQVWTAFQYVPVFIVGYKIYQNGINSNPFVWIALHTATFIFINLLSDGNLIIKVSVLGMTFLNHIFGAFMAWTTLQWVGRRVNYQRNKIYKLFSKYSMTIYLFHQQIIYFVIWNLNGKINTVMIAILNYIISLTLSLLISVVLGRFKLTRIFIGES